MESGIFLGISISLFILVNFFHLNIPERFHSLIGVILTLIPVGLWLYFSWWQERFVPQPRHQLLTVAMLSVLVANAVGIPLLNDFLGLDRWLPLGSAVNRIIGYTITAGVVQEFLKYLVVRYTAWPNHFRTRLDGVAYGAAAAIGYATILNLHLIFSDVPAPDAAAARIFANLALHLVTGILVGYGLAEIGLGVPTPLLPVFTVALAALITGIAIPVRSGLINASLNLGVSAPRPLLGIVFSLVLLILSCLALSFFYDNAERQSQESIGEHGD
jgi:RsiW-degrading membrane proteinase PrsW (M82 family)